ncbi:MAG: 3'-5' exonuclease [Eubacterium sp.]|uniref:3'-5' exonuclease n=1 Tax=Eubacterium sp. TaxID=142586 RepID=UPI003994A3DB
MTRGEASTVNENDNIVRILSIHKSKGLQFPIVFICDTSSNFVADAGTVDISDNGYASRCHFSRCQTNRYTYI